MKEIRLEYMRPRQIVDAMKEKPIIYLPVSPIEWHGLHNPVGVDGIDVPDNILPSMYWDLDAYHLMIKEYIRLIAGYGCKLIVIVVNHGALEEVAKEMDLRLTGCHVLWTSCCGSGFDKYNDRGHASKGETSIVMYIRPECVDLNELPSKEEQAYMLSREQGVYDPRFFSEEPNEDYRLLNDPLSPP